MMLVTFWYGARLMFSGSVCKNGNPLDNEKCSKNKKQNNKREIERERERERERDRCCRKSPVVFPPRVERRISPFHDSPLFTFQNSSVRAGRLYYFSQLLQHSEAFEDEDGRVVHVHLIRHLHLFLHLLSSVHSRGRSAIVAEERTAVAEDHRESTKMESSISATARFQLPQLRGDDQLAETVQRRLL